MTNLLTRATACRSMRPRRAVGQGAHTVEDETVIFEVAA
jgi:hypothetical protein